MARQHPSGFCVNDSLFLFEKLNKPGYFFMLLDKSTPLLHTWTYPGQWSHRGDMENPNKLKITPNPYWTNGHRCLASHEIRKKEKKENS